MECGVKKTERETDHLAFSEKGKERDDESVRRWSVTSEKDRPAAETCLAPLESGLRALVCGLFIGH